MIQYFVEDIPHAEQPFVLWSVLRLFYFFFSFLTALLVPSALLIFSLSQYSSKICNVSLSNLTAI